MRMHTSRCIATGTPAAVCTAHFRCAPERVAAVKGVTENAAELAERLRLRATSNVP